MPKGTKTAPLPPRVTKGIKALRTVLKRARWDDQGGYVSYQGDGKWSFVTGGLPQATPEEWNALMALAGIVPDVIIPKGSCEDCVHSINGRERGYQHPCGPCKRPIHSNFEQKPITITRRKKSNLLTVA